MNHNMQIIERVIGKKLFEPKQREKVFNAGNVKGLATYSVQTHWRKKRPLNTALGDDERKEEIVYDEDDETEHTGTVALNIVADMKNTTLHSVENRLDQA